MNLQTRQLWTRAHFGKSKAAIKKQRNNNRVRVVHRQNTKSVLRDNTVVYKNPNCTAQEIQNMRQNQVMEQLEFDLRRRETFDAIQKKCQDTRF